jgi:phosphatidyl-myo-inositol dimannoside synthase
VSAAGGESRYLVLTPGVTGADGVAEMSRLVVRALRGSVGDRARGVDVLSMTDPPGFTMKDHGARDARCAGAGGRKSRFIGAAIRAWLAGGRRRPIVCLHLHLSPVARLIAGPRAPLVTLLAGIEAWKPLRGTERAAVRRSDLLVAISAHTARRFRETHPGLGDRPIRVCHLGVRDRDGAGLDAPADSAAALRGKPFALIVGRLSARERYKGHDLLMDLWPRVRAEAPGAMLVIVGDGDDRPRLAARASGDGQHVRVLGGVSDAALAALYRDCLFFVMPSRDEGFGLVFLEAMQMGKACIGGAGAAAEVIDEGVTGLVVDPGRPAEVLDAVLRLFREPQTRERMGRAGAGRVAREFTEAHFRSRFRAVLGLPPGTA